MLIYILCGKIIDMNTEYEVKFCNVNIEEIQNKIKSLGGSLESPMRLMRRVVIDTPELKEKDAFLRVRDQGDKITLTYKQFQGSGVDGAKELEVTVSDFQTMVDILKAMSLNYKSFQESKRETWVLEDAEIVIDEWPWLNPYIEIEGKSEEHVKEIAGKLGFSWDDAVFGDVMGAYKNQYPNTPADFTVGNIKEVKFESSAPTELS